MRLLRDESGQLVVELSLLVVLITLIILLLSLFFGPKIHSIIHNLDQLPKYNPTRGLYLR